MRHRVKRYPLLVSMSFLLAGLVLTASAQMAEGPTEPGAGEWRTWVLASVKELRLLAPRGPSDPCEHAVAAVAAFIGRAKHDGAE
jgi:hypothetical protein